MVSISAVRDGLAVRLQTISGIRVSDVVPDQPNDHLDKPLAFIEPPAEIDYHASFSGTADLVFTITVMVPIGAGLKRAQDAIDPYLDTTGTTSIKAAIEGDKTLDGIVHDLTVRRAFDIGLLEWGDGMRYGAKFQVEITG